MQVLIVNFFNEFRREITAAIEGNEFLKGIMR